MAIGRIKELVEIKHQGAPAKEVILNDGTIVSKDKDVANEIIKAAKQLFALNEPSEQNIYRTQVIKYFFEELDLKKSLINLPTNKALGEDLFAPEILLDQELQSTVIDALVKILNEINILKYLKQSRICALSKTNSATVPTGDLRFI